MSHNQVDPAPRAPYTAQSAIGVDRQLPRNSTMSVTYTFSRGVHESLTRDINAPIIGMYPYANAPLPYGGDNPILQYESAGSLRQQQVIANFNTRFSRRITLFGFYTLNFADSNTDGIGTVPANPYNLSTEWGPARFDIRNRVVRRRFSEYAGACFPEPVHYRQFRSAFQHYRWPGPLRRPDV